MVEHSLDQTYGALADSTRRGMLVTLRDGPARITDLAAPLPISFAAAARHVGVLETAGLIERAVRGRDHWLTVRSAGPRPADRCASTSRTAAPRYTSPAGSSNWTGRGGSGSAGAARTGRIPRCRARSPCPWRNTARA